MRLRDGKWECVHCGAPLDDVPEGSKPRMAIHTSSARPTERVLSVDGREIHRCPMVRHDEWPSPRVPQSN